MWGGGLVPTNGAGVGKRETARERQRAGEMVRGQGALALERNGEAEGARLFHPRVCVWEGRSRVQRIESDDEGG